LANPTHVYECEFNFIVEDIERFRAQRIKYECFQVLHPWAYDLDNVDFKYILNNNLTEKVCRLLRTQNAQVFWLSFFKSQSAVSSDEFFIALRELCLMNKIPEFFAQSTPAYHQSSVSQDFLVSLEKDAQQIAIFVQQIADAGCSQGYNCLKDQVKSYTGNFDASDVLINELPKGFNVNEEQNRDFTLHQLSDNALGVDSCLERKQFDCLTNQASQHRLHLTFESVDTEELKNLSFSFEGDSGIFKVGEGEANHYQIPNDKKLWESQFMIVCKDGRYFIRDMGVVHTSRVKVDKSTEIQLQQDMLVDLGKVVHY